MSRRYVASPAATAATMRGMEPPLIGLLTAILVPLGMLALRALTRQRSSVAETNGISVFEGDPATCRQRLDLLADAGVVAWIEDREHGQALLVDAEQAAEVPTLLRSPPQERPELDPQQALGLGEHDRPIT